MSGKVRRKSGLHNFRRSLAYLWPHRRSLIIGLVAAAGVSVFYTFSVSSVIPLLKVIFAENESLVDWINRVEAQRRLDIVIGENVPDDPEGLVLTHVSPDSKSASLLKSGCRLKAVAGEPQSSYAMLRILAQHPDKELSQVTVAQPDGTTSDIKLKLRRYHWWSSALQSVARWLPHGKDPASRLNTLAIVMGALVVVAFLGGICRLINEGLIAIAVQRAMHDLRSGLADHVLRLPLQWHSAQPPGDTLGRFANDISKVEVGQMTLFGKVISEPLKAIGVLVLTLAIDWRLLLVAVSGVPIGVIAMGSFGRSVKRAQKRASQSWGRLLDHLGEKLAGIRVVKAYGMQDVESRWFQNEGRTLTKAQTHIEVIDAATKPVLETLAVVAVSLFVLYGGMRVFSNTLEPHLFFAAVVCLGGLYDPVRKLGNVNNRLMAAEASSKRLFELSDLRPEDRSMDSTVTRSLPAFRDRIEFCDVCFAYEGHEDRPVLSDVSLTVEKGQVVALVGPNGSGKTTLMSLLLRFYEPTRGAILIDRQDIRRVRLESLRAQIGLVTQDSVVFSGTVRSNIAYGADALATEEMIREAARLAHINDFIQTLRVTHEGETSVGYDAHITSRMLSGGQKQRLALARAILRDPPILILDEATSQIDSESERKIQEALDDVTRGRTTFIIAHRLSTIARADFIVVLNEGRLVASGRHEELIDSCPFYVNLCQTQFAYGP